MDPEMNNGVPQEGGMEGASAPEVTPETPATETPAEEVPATEGEAPVEGEM